MTPAQPTALVEVTHGARQALQAAWDSYPFGLPPIIFTDAEADHLIASIRRAALEEAALVAEQYPTMEFAAIPIIRGIATAIRKANDLSHE